MTRENCIAALQDYISACKDAGTAPGCNNYIAWRIDQPNNYPHATTIMKHLGHWRTAIKTVDPDITFKEYEKQDFVDAFKKFQAHCREQNLVMDSVNYENWQTANPDNPNLNAVRSFFISWRNALIRTGFSGVLPTGYKIKRRKGFTF